LKRRSLKRDIDLGLHIAAARWGNVAAGWGNGARVADPTGASCAVEGRTRPGRRRRGTRGDG
jgi:hypothetical protein